VKAWMQNAGQLVTREQNSDAYVDLLENQMTYIEEEFYELLHAYNNLDRSDVIKEAIDLIWVTYGLLHIMGVDTDQAFSKVAESNQSKIPFTYKDGKVQKGPNYQKPDLSKL
jgi:predicted HAD superfamily Cof-like phosphohydrolase